MACLCCCLVLLSCFIKFFFSYKVWEFDITSASFTCLVWSACTAALATETLAAACCRVNVGNEVLKVKAEVVGVNPPFTTANWFPKYLLTEVAVIWWVGLASTSILCTLPEPKTPWHRLATVETEVKAMSVGAIAKDESRVQTKKEPSHSDKTKSTFASELKIRKLVTERCRKNTDGL